MSTIKQSVIKEIAREIASGNTCYIQRYTAKVIIIDHSIENTKLKAAQEQTQTQIERKIDDYVKIEKPNTENQLVVMRNFIGELSDRSVRKQLSNALNRKNPVRNFNTTIESDMELNQHWRNFNVEEYQRWVSNVIIDAYNY